MTTLTSPTVQITVDGQRYRAPERIRSVRVSSQLARPAQCEVVIAAGPDPGSWPQGWELGATLGVSIAGADGDLFGGEVTCVELAHAPDGTAEVLVRAYDVLHRLRKRQSLRDFTDLTVAQLAERLTSDLKLEVAAPEPGPKLDRLVQLGQSDLELLTDTASAAGLYPVLRDRELRLVSLTGHGEPVPLELGRSLWDLRAEANLDRVARRVTALGWHGQRAEALAGSGTSQRGRAGASLAPEPEMVGLDGHRLLVDQPGRSEDQLAATAQAALDASCGAAVAITGVAEGNRQLWAGARVALGGVPERLAGEYVVTEAVHTVTADGFLTTFTTEPPRRPAPVPATAVLTLGVVTDVDDPGGLGRVRVRLPAHGDVDLGWLGVVCPGAGKGRGVVALPDVGDTVAVAYPHRDPVNGVVIGSLFGTIRPPDPGVVRDRVRRWSMRTGGGQQVVLDDDAQVLRVENNEGSFMELGPRRARLHCETDLVIDAPGRSLTIRASSVEFERAVL